MRKIDDTKTSIRAAPLSNTTWDRAATEVEAVNHRIVERLGLEGTSKIKSFKQDVKGCFLRAEHAAFCTAASSGGGERLSGR